MSASHYLSFVEQTFHYFSRAHDEVPSTPVASPAAWSSADLANDPSWRTDFTNAQIGEIDAAIEHARSTQKPLGALTKADFPLPGLQGEIEEWRHQLNRGLGLKVLSGLPVADWGEENASIFFWCIGLHLGRPGAQNQKGDLLGHVRDTGADQTNPFVRQYLTRQNICFHCDAADVVGLLCLNKAKSGGKSRIASSVYAFNQLIKEHPDLAPRLFEPFMLDVREEEDTSNAKVLPIPPCRYSNGILKTFYHAEYFRTSARHEGVSLSEADEEVLAAYDQITARPEVFFDMAFEPGDIQFLSNHTVIHARTDYEDYDEPERKRHLLRLWLSIKDDE